MINEYEIELKAQPLTPGKSIEIRRREYAYSVTDACLQAFMNVSPDYPSDRFELSILHVGPPADRIAKEAQDLVVAISKAFERLSAGQTTKMPKVTKA